VTSKRIEYQFGDRITQHGDNNIGVARYQSPTLLDPRVAIQELVVAARRLQGQVTGTDRETIEESLNWLGAEPNINNVDRGRLRRVLATIAGVAQLAGKVGVPVVEAARKAIEACQT
jgi:hypothetical protein